MLREIIRLIFQSIQSEEETKLKQNCDMNLTTAAHRCENDLTTRVNIE